MREVAGNTAAPATRLRIRRRGCCVTNRRSLPRGPDWARGFTDLRTPVFMIPSHGNYCVTRPLMFAALMIGLISLNLDVCLADDTAVVIISFAKKRAEIGAAH